MWDIFLSHASEDKQDVVRPLARLLEGRGKRVWLDEQQIALGDRLRGKIDEGLARSRWAVVVLSPHYLQLSTSAWHTIWRSVLQEVTHAAPGE